MPGRLPREIALTIDTVRWRSLTVSLRDPPVLAPEQLHRYVQQYGDLLEGSILVKGWA